MGGEMSEFGRQERRGSVPDVPHREAPDGRVLSAAQREEEQFAEVKAKASALAALLTERYKAHAASIGTRHDRFWDDTGTVEQRALQRMLWLDEDRASHPFPRDAEGEKRTVQDEKNVFDRMEKKYGDSEEGKAIFDEDLAKQVAYYEHKDAVAADYERRKGEIVPQIEALLKDLRETGSRQAENWSRALEEINGTASRSRRIE